MSNLNSKVAVVTGASKGIGAAIAKALAVAGAAVVVNYGSDKVGASKTVAAIQQAGGRAAAVQADRHNAITARKSRCVSEFHRDLGKMCKFCA